MGGFDLGWQAAANKNQQNRQIAEQQRVINQNTVGARLLDAINNAANIKPQIKDADGNLIDNPAYADAQKAKQDLITEYMGLHSPEQHANFADRLHGLIFGHPTPHTQQPALSPNSSPVTPTPTPADQGVQPAPPAAPEPLHPMAPVPGDHPLNAITKGISVLGNHLKAFANPKPAPPPVDPALMAKYYADPNQMAQERNMELLGLRGENALKVQELKNEYLKQQLMARPPRLLTQAQIPQFLKELQVRPEMMDDLVGPTGLPLTPDKLAELPQNMVVREFQAGNRTFYEVGDQNSKTGTFGGITFNIPSVGPITTENSTPLGLATSMIPKEHEVPGMAPGEKVNLTTQPTSVPGMMGAPPAAPAAPPVTAPPLDNGAPAPVLKTRPTVTPTLPPSPSQQATVAKTNAKRSQSKQIPAATGAPMPPPFAPGTMLQQGRSARPIVDAMSTVAAQVFGGNGEPPIWENAYMFDDPKLRTALNKALTMNALAIPGTEDDPSFTQTLATAVGATGWTQEQIYKANVEARNELQRIGGDKAMEMFARMAGLQEDLSALRTATKASAAQGSIRTLVRAAPVYNVASSKNFRDQLGVTLNTAAAAMKGEALNPAYINWWERGASAARGGPTSTNAPKVGGKPKLRVQTSPSTGQSRYSLDGGTTWQMGLPPQQPPQ